MPSSSSLSTRDRHGTGHDCSKINGSLALKSSSLPDSASHPIPSSSSSTVLLLIRSDLCVILYSSSLQTDSIMVYCCLFNSAMRATMMMIIISISIVVFMAV